MADPIHQFEIQKIVDFQVGSMDLSYTNSALWMTIAVVVSTVFLTMAMGRKSLVPGRAQVLAEMLYEFIAGMIRENIGADGRKYFPFIFTIFMVVLMGNLLGLIPYSFTYTSHIVVTFALAALVFFAVVIFGLINHGMHFFSLFLPPGLPKWLWPMIIPIEFISFLIRPVTLSVRLFANMMAGHLMLKVFAGFSVAMVSAGALGMLASTMPMVFNTILIGFEFLIALIHAYVFAVLSCIYLKDTVELAH
ncbi:MAG TPA: F0F1 ATP synthase subunit A [Micavibrio sp.]|nr:F0F1 ATP synthase subunit A [Pseudomonadota bacterium]HIF26686.1 F0F1 ATP synthase subunit A [Micavibrio sp.]HIL28722.1 F0F1 ATP synthase subunit A [Micavibrio sp.]